MSAFANERSTFALGKAQRALPRLVVDCQEVVNLSQRSGNAPLQFRLAALRTTRRYPKPEKEMTVRDAFRRVGADEWDALRQRFRTAPDRAAE